METVKKIFPNENADFYHNMAVVLSNKKAHQWLDETEAAITKARKDGDVVNYLEIIKK